jgi:hypothetical protein
MKVVAEYVPRTGKRVVQAKKCANSIAAKKATMQEDSIEAAVSGLVAFALRQGTAQRPVEGCIPWTQNRLV